MKRGLFRIDKPFELHPLAAKIDKHSDGYARRLQIVKQLRLSTFMAR
jgi:hypothetical protein